MEYILQPPNKYWSLVADTSRACTEEEVAELQVSSVVILSMTVTDDFISWMACIVYSWNVCICCAIFTTYNLAAAGVMLKDLKGYYVIYTTISAVCWLGPATRQVRTGVRCHALDRHSWVHECISARWCHAACGAEGSWTFNSTQTLDSMGQSFAEQGRLAWGG